MSAWKPLQMPQHQAVALLQQLRARPRVMAGLRKNAVMNLAEPSGSSPPEKPPGRKIDLRCAR